MGGKPRAQTLDFEGIAVRLRALHARKDFSGFGAQAHRYQIGPPLSEREVAEVETQYHITLPIEYRQFLTQVGCGGAGPYYGLFPLRKQRGKWSWQGDGAELLSDPSKPFPHTKAWNLPPSFFDRMPKWDSQSSQRDYDAAAERWDQLLEQEYWAPSIMDGALPLCHMGCAYRIWLVVTGPEAGNMWTDDRVDDKGVAPLTHNKAGRVSFGDWYWDWLLTGTRS